MPVVPPRLTAVTLGARHLPTLRRFYQLLGWSEVNGSDDNWCGFLLGGVLLTLYPVGALGAEVGATGSPGAWSAVTLACNVDNAAEVDQVYAAAVAAGATGVAVPVDRDWGGRSGYIADPEGNHWEIAWAPGAVFDERGALASFG